VIETARKPEAEDDPQTVLCGCGHPLDDHDAIARRYCNATLAGVLPRGCVCRQ
jgi:hypothetical protein